MNKGVMGSNDQPVPDDCHSVTPYPIAADAARAVEFYKLVFPRSFGSQTPPASLYAPGILVMDEFQNPTAALRGQ